MHGSLRTYLNAGLSTVAVGAVIAAPMNPPSPQPVSPRPQVRSNEIHLAALPAALTIGGLTERPELVHQLAEVSRGSATTKAALAAAGHANPLLSQSAPDPRVQGQDGAPGSAAVNTVDVRAIAYVFATAVQLTLDTVITAPATFVQGTVANLNQVILAVSTLDPNEVSHAVQGFVVGETLTIGVIATDLQADIQSLSDAVGRLDPTTEGSDAVSRVKSTATDKTAAEAGVDDSVTAAETTTPSESRGHWQESRGEEVHETSSRSRRHTADTTDSSTSNASHENLGDAVESSDSKSTDAQNGDTSDVKNGNASRPGHHIGGTPVARRSATRVEHSAHAHTSRNTKG